MSRLRLLATVLLTVLVAVPVFAQGTTGTLTGNVTDEQGGALPGANVTVQNTSTGFSRSTTADSTGAFNVPGLPVGTYEIKSELSGFATRTLKGIEVNVKYIDPSYAIRSVPARPGLRSSRFRCRSACSVSSMIIRSRRSRTIRSSTRTPRTSIRWN